MEKEIFQRAQLLLGSRVMERMANARVILFGVGGVGSWCAEGLVRSGIRRLTIVDSDRVCLSNINRQLMATTQTVGQIKVDALKEHLLLVNPEAQIDSRHEVFNEATAEGFHLEEYDYIVDAIDSLKDKMLLIQMATRTDAVLFSSMGAALKLDPTTIRVAEFWKVKGCPLAKALRQRFKKQKTRPSKKFLCVFSEQLLKNEGAADFTETVVHIPVPEGEHRSSNPRANGSLLHMTGIYGFTLAGLVVKDIVQKTEELSAGQETSGHEIPHTP